MDINDIEKLVDGDPDTLIQKAAEMGIDFSGLSNDIAREIVKKSFLLTKNSSRLLILFSGYHIWLKKTQKI